MTAQQARVQTGDGLDRVRLVEHVVEQLAGQLPAGPALPVLIPTVGFGGQNRAVLGDTIAELARGNGVRCRSRWCCW